MLRTPSAIGVPSPSIAETEPRPGQIVIALARSWSNAVTASAGIVAVVGGPLRTGRRRQISRVIRVTAPMHEGFAGGAVYDASGRLTGLATASAIRGFGVAIPASIAWASAAKILTAGTPRRGFVGLALQAVELAPAQRPDGRERALLVLAVTPGSPADAAGLIVGDVLLDFDGQPTESPDDLLDLLTGNRVGRTVLARTLRGGALREVSIDVVERPRRDRLRQGYARELAREADRDAARRVLIVVMRVVLVGPPARRQRLRAQLPEGIDVAGEAATLGAARALDADVDAYLLAAAETLVEERLVEPLTPRELQVLSLVADGLPNKAIAAALGVSDETVKFHLGSVFGKLGASNRTDAVRQALRRGLIPL